MTRAWQVGLALVLAATAGTALAQADKPIKIGISTAVALQVGRDSTDCAQLAIDEIIA